MHIHPSARLISLGRERLVRPYIDEQIPLDELVCHAGISLRTAYEWLARLRTGGPAALVDRRSVRRHQRRTLHPQQLQRCAMSAARSVVLPRSW